MRSGRYTVAILSTFLVSLLGFSGESDQEIRSILVSKVFKADPMPVSAEEEKNLEVPVAIPKAEGVHVQAGKSAEWVIDNSVKTNGWSFSGWSKTGLDEDFRPWRLHIGVISGALDANKAYDLSDKFGTTPDYQILEEWERERTNGVVFGIVFVKRF